jgi:hypothetical protein
MKKNEITNLKKLEKILYVIPEYLSGKSFLQPPIDILLSSRLIKQRLGLDTHLIDNRVKRYSPKELVKSIEKLSPDIIILSTSPYDVSQNYFVDYRIYSTEATIRNIKTNLPYIPLIVVGPHGSIRPDILLKNTNYIIDVIIKWEYEITLINLLRALKSQTSLHQITNLPNLIVKHNSSYLQTPFSTELAHPREFPVIPDVEIIKDVARQYFGDTYINGKPKKKFGFGVLLFQRGCPYKCRFCFRFLGNYKRTIQNSYKIEETISEWEKIGIKDFFVLDYNFTADENYLKKMKETLKNLDVSLTAQTRCDLIDKKTITYLEKMPISLLWLGIESFDYNIQKIINKYDKSYSSIQKSLELLEKSKIPNGAFLQFGLPGETLRSIQKGLEYIWKHKLVYTKSIILHQPLYGTECYILAKKQYPWIGGDWSDISTVRGLVNNEMSPGILLKLVNFLRSRTIFELESPPSIEEVLSRE